MEPFKNGKSLRFDILGVTVDDRRYDRSVSEGNEAIFDCTGGIDIAKYGICSGKATKSLRWMPWYQQPMKDV